MANVKQEVKPYMTIPTVPQDFDGAVAVNREARRAVEYWKETKRYARFSNEQLEAHKMVQRWESVADSSDRIIKSFQLRLF